MCAIETIWIQFSETLACKLEPAHVDFEGALFSIEILSFLRVHFGSFVQIRSGVVKTKSQTPLKNYPESSVECTRPVASRPCCRVSLQLSIHSRFHWLHRLAPQQENLDIEVLRVFLVVEILVLRRKVAPGSRRVIGTGRAGTHPRWPSRVSQNTPSADP